ncbi:hypothetical protein FB45DRAFT_1117391 [Roridomyces roridus]|uniref:Uncharacterized protein n=1 Tax=Roridomyces roridus TaxID=1738132 RepID=A0AAD7B7W8_9AGAR|nr:hypothetical protein FB45DRAFT_1117391 [Roridomyces roridus]
MPLPFPQELIDKTIDSLAEIVPLRPWEIAKCGLISRAWAKRSRFHLFRRVCFGAKESRLSAFVDIVGARPSILSIIRHIELCLGDEPFEKSILERINPCPNLASVRIYVMASQSTGTQGVDARLADLSPQFLLWSQSSSASVSRLALERFDTGRRVPLSVNTVSQILSSFPSVQFLSLGDEFNIEDVGSVSISFPPGMRDLTISGRAFPPVIFARLIAHPSMSHITSLALYQLDLADRSIQAYFRRAGCRLESLTLDSYPNNANSADAIQSVLQYTTTNIRDFTSHAKRPRQILSVLSCLPPSDWICITLFVAAFNDADIPWAKLDDALSDDRFARLRTFRVQRRLAGPGPYNQQNLVTSRSRRWMPRANERGILGGSVFG